jgi:L-ascorbate metabolism protein UlaG (beta-lactamase superfamily)
MRILRRALIGLAIVAAAAMGWLMYRLRDHPSLEPYARHQLASPDGHTGGAQVRVTFLGVATLLIDDGETKLMTDGFFTRPAKAATFLGKIAPNRELIAATLRRAGVDKLAAVITVHSHYDHAMDTPEVARLTGAVVIGSPSTANIARGWQLPEAQIRVVEPNLPMHFGAFTVTLVPSRHFPHGMAMGEIEGPLVPPVRATDYREGGSYSVFIEHPLGSLLIQGSAGWVDGALTGRHADVVLLGIGALGSKDASYRETYYREVVDAVGPQCVIPIHWDDFTLPLDQPLQAMPNLLDDVEASMRFLIDQTTRRHVGFGLLPVWKAVPLLGAGRVLCNDEPQDQHIIASSHGAP